MPSVLIVGDSQAQGPMGQRLEALFRDNGYSTERLSQVGWSTYRWVAERLGDILSRTRSSTPPDLVVYIFGSNDVDPRRAEAAATTLRDVGGETWFVGAPRYEDAELTARTERTRPGFRRVFGDRYVDSRQFTTADCAGRWREPRGDHRCIHYSARSPEARRWADGVFYEMRRRRRRGAAGRAGSSFMQWALPLGLAAVVTVFVISRLRSPKRRLAAAA
jgi:hypothetical protein